MSIVLLGSTSGSCTLQEQAVAGTTVLTLPTTSGTVSLDGPAFSAYLSSNQTVTSGVFTKIQLNTEIFDTAACFNNTGSTVGGIPAYAFLPNVAGYYQVNITGGVNASVSLSFNYITLYKNGSAVNLAIYPPYGGASQYGNLSALVFLNGTTDYLELYIRIDGSGTMSINGNTPPANTSMSCSLVRAS